MYAVTNPKTGKTYTYANRNLARANTLASKLGVKVVSHQTFRCPDGTTIPVVSELEWTGQQNVARTCPHGNIVGYCDRGGSLCDTLGAR